MREIIEAAKKKAEAELDRKIELSKQYGTDAREIFTSEDFDEICRRNEFFDARVTDLEKRLRYEKLKAAALWLDANSLEVAGVEIEAISKERPNVIVSLVFRRLVYMRGIELQAFSAMCALADTVFVSGVADSVIRVAFELENV